MVVPGNLYYRAYARENSRAGLICEGRAILRRYRVLVSYTPGHVAPRYPRLIINIMRKCMTTLIEKMIALWEEELQDEEVFRHIRGPNES